MKTLHTFYITPHTTRNWCIRHISSRAISLSVLVATELLLRLVVVVTLTVVVVQVVVAAVLVATVVVVAVVAVVDTGGGNGGVVVVAVVVLLDTDVESVVITENSSFAR